MCSKTAVVYNVTPRALGLIVNKEVGNHVIKKRINVRIEHVRPSRCREEYLKRKVVNAKLRQEAKSKGIGMPWPR